MHTHYGTVLVRFRSTDENVQRLRTDIRVRVRKRTGSGARYDKVRAVQVVWYRRERRTYSTYRTSRTLQYNPYRRIEQVVRYSTRTGKNTHIDRSLEIIIVVIAVSEIRYVHTKTISSSLGVPVVVAKT